MPYKLQLDVWLVFTSCEQELVTWPIVPCQSVYFMICKQIISKSKSNSVRHLPRRGSLTQNRDTEKQKDRRNSNSWHNFDSNYQQIRDQWISQQHLGLPREKLPPPKMGHFFLFYISGNGLSNYISQQGSC